MGKNNKRKWTVFFLIKSQGTLIKYVIQMINEIRSLELQGRLPIIIGIYFERENLKALLEGNVEYVNESDLNTPTTMFLSIIPDNDPYKTKPNKLEIIGEDREFDITNSGSVENYFRNQVLNEFKAKHYLLLTWDHGKFFFIFDSIGSDESGATNKGILLKPNNELPALTMEELANAIQWAFDKQKIDVMVMMNCNMQSVDAGYALRGSVKYLVAPQTAIFMDGYNYPSIFQMLLNRPGVSPKKLAKHVVKSFRSKVFPSVEQSMESRKEVAIFACDLRYYTYLGELIDKLVSHLLLNIDVIKTNIEAIRRFSGVSINDDSMADKLDFRAFISVLIKLDVFKKDFLPASMILALTELIILESFIGDSFVSRLREENLINRPSGISIFLPNSLPSQLPTPVFDDYFKTDFMKHTKWIEFVRKVNE